MVTTATRLPSSLPWAGLEIPEGFTLSLAGLFRSKSDGDEIKISGPIWVKANTENQSTGTFGTVIAWIDRRGRQREQAFPCRLLHEYSRSIVQILADQGLPIVPRQARFLLDYLGAHSDNIPWMQSVERVGWLSGEDSALRFAHAAGVLPDSADEPVIFQPQDPGASASLLRTRGTLEEWNEHVTEPCAGNPFLEFALCCGFAGLILEFSGLENGGFHLYGRSSQGKTTAAQVAASVLGCGADPADSPEKAYTQRWNATRNALEAISSAYNDATLVLDEIQTSDDRDFGGLIHNVLGGRGKQALTRERSLKTQRVWRVLMLSTGEISIKQKIELNGKKPSAGQLLRLLDIPIRAGIVRNTQRKAASQFATDLKTHCSRFYGIAGRTFIERLSLKYEYRSAVTAVIKERLERTVAEIDSPNRAPEQRRAMKRFALLIVAGQLAIELGILKHSGESLKKAILRIRDEWLEDAEQIPDVVRGVLAVQDFVSRYGESRFRLASSNSFEDYRIPALAGYRKNDGDKHLYLFNPESFREACDELNPSDIARELKRLNLLITKEQGHLTAKHVIDCRRRRFYAISDRILEFDYDERGLRGAGAA